MPVTPLTSTPRHISADAHAELTSATPADFAEIPPILRWEGEVEVTPPATNDGTANGHADKQTGTLWVTEEALSFLPASGEGFTIPYPQLTLHALTGAEDGPAHIYCQLDLGDEAEEGEEYTPLSEMRIFAQPEQLEPLFAALSRCSALHASLLPSGEPSSFFGGGEWYGADGEFDNAEGDEDDEDDDEEHGGREDEISRFLAKVDWSGVETPTAANMAEDAAYTAGMARFKAQSEAPPVRDLNVLARQDLGPSLNALAAPKEDQGVDLAAAFARFREEYDAGWGDVQSPLSSNDGLKAELEVAREKIRSLEARLEEMKVGEGEGWEDVKTNGAGADDKA